MLLVATAVVSAATAAGACVAYKKRRSQSLRAQVERRHRTARLAGDSRRQAELEAALSRAATLQQRLEVQLKEAEEELATDEERLAHEEAAQERRASQISERDQALGDRFDVLKTRRREVEGLRRELRELDERFLTGLESLTGETRTDVTRDLSDSLTAEAEMAAQKAARALEMQSENRAEDEAHRMMGMVCQRYGVALPANRLISTVSLPRRKNLQERILADHAEVLKAITEVCQVEFVPRDGDEFFLQAPDPFTREMGRLAYERLVKSGKISVETATKAAKKAIVDLDKIANDAGIRAARILKLKGIDQEILYLVGKLLYRTSYTQNQWQHAIETAHLCGMMAEQMNLDIRTAQRAGLLHDIGKVLWAETEAVGSHAVSGATFAAAHGELPEIVHPIAAHHGDEKPSSPLAHLVAAGDALSGARPGARRETLEAYTQRVDDIERICDGFKKRGIRRAYVISGGREVRVHVDPKRLDDQSATRLSSDLARQIEEECIYPGQIKVVVLRETQAQSVVRG